MAPKALKVLPLRQPPPSAAAPGTVRKSARIGFAFAREEGAPQHTEAEDAARCMEDAADASAWLLEGAQLF